MTYYNVIDRFKMVDGQPEDISVPVSNYDAIAAAINNLTDENIAPGAGIQLSKLQTFGTLGGITFEDGNLRVPGYIWTGGDIWAWQNDAQPIGIGHLGPAGEPAIAWDDASIYRDGPFGELRTDILRTNNNQERSEKGQPNGYAPLDATAKVPLANLPPMDLDVEYFGDYAPATTYKDGDIVVYNGISYMCVKDTSSPPVAWPPNVIDLSAYQTRAEEGQPNGYASLDATTKVPLAQLPTMDAGHIPDLSATYQTKSEKGAPNGYAPLDSSTKIAATYLPASATIPAGGTAGQALTKVDATNYNLTWATISGGGGTGLPADTVIVAGTRIIANKLLAGDANDAWRVLGSGRQE